MPKASMCNKIKDPVKRRQCLSYKGSFAKKSSPKTDLAPGPGKPGSPYPKPKPKPPTY